MFSQNSRHRAAVAVKISIWLAVCAAGSASAQAPLPPTLGVYVSPPQVEFTDRPGALTETFDSMDVFEDPTTTPWAIGTATQMVADGAWLMPADPFGGSGGAGNYLYAGDGVSVVLTPNSQYLGFWWSAGDSSNLVRVFDSNDNLLAVFEGDDIVNMLDPQPPLVAPATVTAINGTDYLRTDYIGDPRGVYIYEPYAYVNLVLENTNITFGRIEVSGSNFEVDSLSITPGAGGPPPDHWVEVVKTVLNTPLAFNDSHSMIKNTSWSSTVATNDITTPGSTWVVLANPTHGALAFNPDGSFVYTPTVDYVGNDEFTYQVCKPAPDDADCATAKGLITITATSATSIPTLSEWSMAILSLLLAGGGFLRMRRARAH
jgi:hypothetical protein